jgi:hypothetical protein
VARMGQKRSAYRFFVGKHETKKYLVDQCVEGMRVIQRAFKENNGVWTCLIWRRMGTNTGSCKDGDEPSSCVTCGQIIFLTNELTN